MSLLKKMLYTRKPSRKKIYLMDENIKMSVTDIQEFKNATIINSTDQFPQGTLDEVLTKASKEKGWIIVTKDIRMALRSLIDKVPVIYISDDFKTMCYLSVHIYGSEYYPEMFEYLKERFDYSTPSETEE